MKSRKSIVITLLVVLVAVVALSVNIAMADNGRRPDPGPDPGPAPHAPVCSTAGNLYEMQCFDAGKDISNVMVKSTSPYDLEWNNEFVTLHLVPEKGAIAYWSVYDQAGNVTSGTLP